MKKILLLLLAVGISYLAQAQEVPQTQSSLIIKKTASWCPPCGGWGWDLFEQLIDDNDSQAILWAMHYSGDLMNATTQGIAANLDGSGQPRFYLNNVEKSGSSTSIRNAIKTGVQQNAGLSPVANAIPVDISVDNNQISVTVNATFFAQAEGAYYLNVYVVEDGVVNYQAGQGANAVHEKVLRDDMAGDAFGEILANGPIAANTSFSMDFSIPIADSWDVNHLRLSTVLWKKVGLKYEFVNGTETSGLVVSTQAPALKGAKLAVSPNPVTGKSLISLDFAVPFSGELVLYDVTGRLLREWELGAQGALGHHTKKLDASLLQDGVYWVQLVSPDGLLAQKIVVQHE